MINIECKAKRSDNGKWVSGYAAPIYVIKDNRTAVVCWGIIQKRGFSKIDEVKNGLTYGKPVQYACDPNTICMYTGMRDYGGKKIYVGDIIRVEFGNLKYKYFEVIGADKNRCLLLKGNIFPQSPTGTTVCGNIFDEPTKASEAVDVKEQKDENSSS